MIDKYLEQLVHYLYLLPRHWVFSLLGFTGKGVVEVRVYQNILQNLLFKHYFQIEQLVLGLLARYAYFGHFLKHANFGTGGQEDIEVDNDVLEDIAVVVFDELWEWLLV